MSYVENIIKKKGLSIGLLIAVFFCKELFWAYLVPPWKAPDEIAHYGYVQSLYMEKAFPILGKATFIERNFESGSMRRVGLDEFPGTAAGLSGTFESLPKGPYINWIAQHPPLYYLLMLPFYSMLPHDGYIALMFLRLISIILGCITLYFSHKTLKLLFGNREPFNIVVVSCMAFLPGFSYISALVNNDNLVVALSSVLFFYWVKDIHGYDVRRSIAIGILLGFLALTKVTALPLWIAGFLIGIYKWHRIAGLHPDDKKTLVKDFIFNMSVVFGLAVLICSFWYIRNLQLYGTLLPDMNSAVKSNPHLLIDYPDLGTRFPELVKVPQNFNYSLFDFFVMKNFFYEYFKNFLGLFGFPPINLATWQNISFLSLALASIFGLIRFAYAKIKENRAINRKTDMVIWFLMVVPFLLVFLLLLYKIYHIYLARGILGGMHGRYIYDVLLPVMTGFVTGLLALFGIKSKKTSFIYPVIYGLIVFFVINDFYALLAVVIPNLY